MQTKQFNNLNDLRIFQHSLIYANSCRDFYTLKNKDKFILCWNEWR